ncbi:hypothetical protein IWW36_002994 [Coemansia brasiliensis]|uniref:HMG box domain-containing protein n=1 Tax=Coemansia brasiliensis TaxID=2650707 RepID=A0A9W8IAY9_9FUNG|nr:hypothetical protein IWW36_002994 [Coemansia brasiliensis]
MERQSTELHELLNAIDMMQYYDAFKREGFERLEAIVDIQESDFEAMGVKRGHRRLIHRRAMELVNPQRYSRDLPPISSPLLTAHIMHQTSLENTASPALEEAEPLTAYLYRPNPQALQAQQQGQYRPPLEYGAGPQHHLPTSHSYRGYATSIQQQQQKMAMPSQTYTQLPTVPFPQAHADSPARQTVVSASLPRPLPGLHTRLSKSPPPSKVYPADSIPYISTNVNRQVEPKHQQRHSQTSIHLLQPTSASTDASPSHLPPGNSPLSHPPGPRPSTSAIESANQKPTAKQRQRGHSVSSQPPVASTSTVSRRRGSRADPRSPYLRPAIDPQSPKSPQAQVQQLMPQSPRRTYRRHPKKDPNAPEKWRSAYQLFRDDVNQELHGQEIPFSEMSKIHSKRWAELDDHTRNMYFQRSRNDKEEYLRKMAIYEDTQEYKVCVV